MSPVCSGMGQRTPFHSTLPASGATLPQTLTPNPIEVSIHAPRVGSDYDAHIAVESVQCAYPAGRGKDGTWSLTILQQRLAKTVGGLAKHARCYWPLLAESHLTRRMFGSMLWRILNPLAAPASAKGCMQSRSTTAAPRSTGIVGNSAEGAVRYAHNPRTYPASRACAIRLMKSPSSMNGAHWPYFNRTFLCFLASCQYGIDSSRGRRC